MEIFNFTETKGWAPGTYFIPVQASAKIFYMIRCILCTLAIIVNYVSSAQDKGLDCSSLKHGTYKYLDIEDTTAYFEIDKSNHTEYHQGGKYNIKSKLEWLDDCRYSMVMLSNTIPGFPF